MRYSFWARPSTARSQGGKAASLRAAQSRTATVTCEPRRRFSSENWSATCDRARLRPRSPWGKNYKLMKPRQPSSGMTFEHSGATHSDGIAQLASIGRVPTRRRNLSQFQQVCSERTAKEFSNESCDCRAATCRQRRICLSPNYYPRHLDSSRVEQQRSHRSSARNSPTCGTS